MFTLLFVVVKESRYLLSKVGWFFVLDLSRNVSHSFLWKDTIFKGTSFSAWEDEEEIPEVELPNDSEEAAVDAWECRRLC